MPRFAHDGMTAPQRDLIRRALPHLRPLPLTTNDWTNILNAPAGDYLFG